MKNIYLRATPLPNGKGRIEYISSEKKQENLLGTYDSKANDKGFWDSVIAFAHAQSKYNKNKKVCELRELVVAIPNDLLKEISNYDEFAKHIAEQIKTMLGVECIVALHLNKKRNNFHAHVVLSEYRELERVKTGAVLTRNTYYNELGQRSDKKDCIDSETKKLREGCTMVKKGEQKESRQFGGKINFYKNGTIEQLKENFAQIWNDWILSLSLDEAEEWGTFDPNGPYLAQKKVGKDLPKDIKEARERENEAVREYNYQVSQFLEKGADEEDLIQVKNDIHPNAYAAAIEREMSYWEAFLEEVHKMTEFLKNELENMLHSLNYLIGESYKVYEKLHENDEENEYEEEFER